MRAIRIVRRAIAMVLLIPAILFLYLSYRIEDVPATMWIAQMYTMIKDTADMELVDELLKRATN